MNRDVSVAVIDYGAGNLRSIRRALEAARADAIVTSDLDEVRRADAVVFPGVGAAGAACSSFFSIRKRATRTVSVFFTGTCGRCRQR
jgi:imidazoleglycerol phosphate synthase glutamine amidotransferase subunit HisH